jgi:outer membrane protein insertion porin family
LKNHIIILFLLFIVSQFCFSQESEKYELTKIDFTGNNYFSSSKLRDLISSKESPGWFWKFLNSISSAVGKEPVYFDSLNIQDDIHILNQFYHDNGFFKTNISYSYSVDTTDRTVNLFYNINEGEPSIYKNISLRGLGNLPPDLKTKTFQGLTIDSTQRYTQQDVKDNIDNTISYLQNNGYMLVKFDSTIINMDTINYKTNLEIYFSTGNRYKIKDIVVEKAGEGSSSVDDELLKDIVGIRPEEYYNIDKDRQSQVRLFRTGLFSTVTVAPVYEDTTLNYVPLGIDGYIGKMNELGPEIIMNNQQDMFNLGLGLSYARKNFLGYARKLTLSGSFGVQDFFRADISRLVKKFSINDTTLFGYVESDLKIEQPYVFNEPIFGTLEGYYNIRKDNVLLRSRIYGTKLTFEFEMPSYTFVSFLSLYYNFEVVDANYNVDQVNGQVIAVPMHNNLSIIGADIRSSKVDNPLFPAKGYNLSLLFEDANFIPYLIKKIFSTNYSHAAFYKTSATFSWYALTNENKTSVFAIKLKSGLIQNYFGSDLDIPSTRKFFSGGSNSIRGWRAWELPPERTTIVDGNIVSLVGGDFIFEGSFEFRRKFSNVMGYVLFLDYGNTWSNYSVSRLNEITVATGMGLRYYTDFAPFRIDFGIKTYDPYSNVRIFQRRFFDLLEFQFGIGEAF